MGAGADAGDARAEKPQYWHFLVEAKKLAYADLFTYNADPSVMPVPVDRLLTNAHAQSLCGRVNPQRASGTAAGPLDGSGDTIVLSTADRDGNMVAWVNSLFSAFGSGLVVPGTGIMLHNRGALFTLDLKSPNAIAPHKRPFNTLSAGFVMKDDQPLMTITVMGGDGAGAGHARARRRAGSGANVQAARDMARVPSHRWPTLTLESQLFGLVGSQLTAMGHVVTPINGENVGGCQAIMFTPDESGAAAGAPGPVRGFYRAGSDHRKDGQAVGF